MQVVTVLDEEAYGAALGGPAGTCFVLTNTRSLDEPAAVEINQRAARGLVAVAERAGVRLQLISRSDSTLRGHVMAEVAALQAVRRSAAGREFDGVLLVPAFLEAGRVTAGDIHWARLGADLVPVGETEFARDATFGYRASDLRDFVAEKSGGTIRPGDVASIGLADIRLGGAVPRSGTAGPGPGRPVGGGQRHRILRSRHRGLRRAASRGGRPFVSVPYRALVRAGPARHGPEGAAARCADLAARIARTRAGTGWSWSGRTWARPAGRSPR